VFNARTRCASGAPTTSAIVIVRSFFLKRRGFPSRHGAHDGWRLLADG
jgi:hypothetical protein